MFENRWYDKNPIVSHAVGCIEGADNELRNKLARLIIKHSSCFGIEAKLPERKLFRRWYDKDKDLSLAMECFKNADDEQRLKIANHIICYLRENSN